MDKKERAAEILKRLTKEYGGRPRTALVHRTPFELLAATILSAQTTDVQVNKTTATLFKKYRTIEAFAQADPEALARDVATVNFYRNKAKNIRNAARLINERFGGKVPRTMDELLTLPGVARKTANIVLEGSFGVQAGIAVDTHVRRLSQRLGLTKHDDPVKIEQDLMRLAERSAWGAFSHLLIFHGRAVCGARKPNHGDCVLFDLCPSRAL